MPSPHRRVLGRAACYIAAALLRSVPPAAAALAVSVTAAAIIAPPSPPPSVSHDGSPTGDPENFGLLVTREPTGSIQARCVNYFLQVRVKRRSHSDQTCRHTRQIEPSVCSAWAQRQTVDIDFVHDIMGIEWGVPPSDPSPPSPPPMVAGKRPLQFPTRPRRALSLIHISEPTRRS
eukprot:7391936-Prymnesium_polylepis.1